MIKTYHFPPDLMNLLVDTIPRLNKSKKDLLMFFRNVGVPEKYLKKHCDLLNKDKDEFNKFNVTRDILEDLNKASDYMLGVRRQLLNKVVCFDSFDACWENDRFQAKSNVAEISKIVKLKDSVTKLENLAHEKSQIQRSEQIRKNEKIQINRKRYEDIRNQMNSLFRVH